MTPLQTYLAELNSIRSTGAAVQETSYYLALANLFNAVGKTLKPKVNCVINWANRGAGASRWPGRFLRAGFWTAQRTRNKRNNLAFVLVS